MATSRERVDGNDVVALRAGADHGDAAVTQIFKTLDVRLAGGGQLVDSWTCEMSSVQPGMVS